MNFIWLLNVKLYFVYRWSLVINFQITPMKTVYLLAGILFLSACAKNADPVGDPKIGDDEPENKPAQYSAFVIQQGAHHADQNPVKPVTTSEMKFMVKFDSSAVYQTVLPENQYAINKLWGFSEGIDNHVNSARIGWSWTDNALRLYGYVYVHGILHSQEITSVAVGAEISCSIKPQEDRYLFSINASTVSLPRGPSGAQAIGYQQYPYFGGNEVAPHVITILIKSL
jgi:hypothetical protein